MRAILRAVETGNQASMICPKPLKPSGATVRVVPKIKEYRVRWKSAVKDGRVKTESSTFLCI
jgi:hypothetical protein